MIALSALINQKIKHMKNSFVLSITALLLLLLSAEVHAQQAMTRVLTIAEAQAITEAAMARARQDNWEVSIVVVDAGGHLMNLTRMDGTSLASVKIATQKAQTSVYYRRPTRTFHEGFLEGNNVALALPDAIPLEGGVPILHDDKVIGAVGVSGVTAQQDGIIAQAGIDVLR